MQNHKYSLIDIEMMIPWEREIYVAMLVDDLKQQKQRAQQAQMHRK
jgi:hypothetical protein